MKQRQIYLDNVCGLLIIHMIFICHQPLFCNYTDSAIEFILKLLSFFMAWFFFKAGMVYKERSVKEVVRSSFKRLLVPYMIFSVFGFLIMALQKLLQGFNPVSLEFLSEEFWWLVNKETFFPTQACWFLLSLFVVRVAYSFLQSIKFPPYTIIVAISLMIAWLVYELSVKNDMYYPLNIGNSTYKMHIPFYIGNMFHGLAFYTFGAWLKENQFNRKLFLLALCFFILKFFYFAFMDFRGNDSEDSNYFLCIIYELAGCIVVNNVFRNIANKKIMLLSRIGQNSMIYYLVHYPVMTFIVMFLNPFPNLSSSIRYFLLSAVLIIILIISDYMFRIKWLKWMIGG